MEQSQKTRAVWCWVIAIAVALALLTFTAKTQTISYYDNDDFNIAWALSGNRSGTPSYSHPFVNILLAAAVSGLYALAPMLPWWLIVQLLFIALGVIALTAAALRIVASRGQCILVPLGVMGLLCAALMYYPTALVTFTTTSAVVGLGGVALAMAADGKDSGKRQRFDCIASAVLMTLSVLMRRTAGLSALCFYLAAMLYRFLVFRKASDRRAAVRTAVTAGAAVLAAAALAAVYAWGREAGNPEGFLAFENARALYMDYPHASFSSDPALYASVGWDGTLAGLADKWFYMDARINAASLGAITAASGTTLLPMGKALHELATLLEKYSIARYLVLVSAAAYAAGLIGWLTDRRRILPICIDTCVLLGTGALCVYLAVRGRVNLRAWMTVLLPGCATMALFALHLLPHSCTEKRKRGPGLRRIAAWAACALVGMVGLFGGYRIFRLVWSYSDSTDALLLRANAVVDYALAHPENVYIRDVYAANNFDALTVYPDRKPVNLMDWGGCDMYSKARTAQLAVNGLDSPYADVFFADNVRYVAERDGDCLPLLAEYMVQTRGASGYEVLDTVDGDIVIVRFLKD